MTGVRGSGGWMRVAAAAAVLALPAGGCSASSANAGAGFVPSDNSGSSGSGGPQVPGGGAVILPDGAISLPPETKTESNYQSPVATGRIVWTANPTSGRVAYIDAVSFVVQTVQAGDGPTYLAAVPDPTNQRDQAIVLNVVSHDATFLSRDATGALSAATFPATADANAWAVSSSGRWAIAWADASRVSSPLDPTQGFQAVEVLDLHAGHATQLQVGYRPSQVVFSHDQTASHDETRAFAVTQDGISVIDLGGSAPVVRQNFALTLSTAAGVDGAAPGVDGSAGGVQDAGDAGAVSDGAGVDAPPPDAPAVDAGPSDAAPSEGQAASPGAVGSPDVSFTPDGSYALVRQDPFAAIEVISLTTGATTLVPFPEAPTDLTISPDGNSAVAVLRASSTVAVLRLPDIAADPSAYTTTVIPGQIIGRAIVAQDPATKQRSVLLFTTAAPVDALTVLTLDPAPSYRTVTLHAPVLAVFPSGDAQNAIVLHAVSSAANSQVRGAFSLVPVAQPLPAVIVPLSAAPTAVAVTADRALVSLRDDSTSTFGVDLAMMPSLDVVSYALASPPIAVGIAAASATGFVAQNYTEGRITFVDLDGGGARTITGFELGARVVQGGDP